MENLIAKEKLLWRIIDSSFDGIFMTDAQGEILYCNESYLGISGLKRENLIGRNIGKLVESGEIPDACSPEVIRTHRPLTKVIDYYQGMSALVTSIPIFDDAGRLVRVFSNVRDITELIRLKEQLKNTKDLNEEYRRRLWQVEHGREDARMLTASPVMENIVRLATRIAGIASPVLIQGESGVGKDMLVRLIHDSSENSRERPFVQINCSAIPATLLESELFGYEAGAFTGAAKKGKVGLFELADKGTLFLDEIGDMPLALQAKLLDVLQTGKMFRVGGTKTVQIRTRVIAATNNNLEKMLAEGRFRQDLYYRLNVIPIYVPPLRERREDIVPLLAHFIEKKNREFGLSRKFSPRVMDALTDYGWPGNVRELRNTVEQMMVTAEGDVIDESHLPSHIAKGAVGQERTAGFGEDGDLKTAVAAVEREVIGKALAAAGTLRQAADKLGIDLSTLVRKKRKYKL